MWTSSRTTSGFGSAISRTASSTEPASPRTSTRPSSSARTPARKMRVVVDDDDARRRRRSFWLARDRQLDLGAAARARADRRRVPPWRSIRPMIDSRTPRRSAGTASGSKPGPRSRTKTCARRVARARRRRRSRPRPARTWPRSPSPRGPRRRAPRRARRSAQSPTATTSIGTPCASSTSAAACSSAAARLSPSRPARAVEEPCPQLALLAPGQLRDLARVAGALLHQGQRLQHRVVQVGGELGALLGADPLGPLAGEVAAEPPEKRSQDQRQPRRRRDHREHDVARIAEDVVRGEEEQHRAEDQRDAEATPVEVGEPAGRVGLRRPGGCRRPAAVPRLTRPPPEAQPRRRAERLSPAAWRQRSVAPEAARISGHMRASDHQMPELAQDQEQREGEQGDAGRRPASWPPARRRAARRGRSPSRRRADAPGSATRRRRRRSARAPQLATTTIAKPTRTRIGSIPSQRANAGADAGDDRVVAVADQARRRSSVAVALTP